MLPLPITEYDIQALVDSHLTWEEEKQVWQAIRSNRALRSYYTQIVNQKKLLLLWAQSEEEKKGDKTGCR